MNRAVDGDTMAVEVLEEARAPAKVVLQDEGFNLGDTLEAANTLLSKAVKSKEEQVAGRVVGIVRRK